MSKKKIIFYTGSRADYGILEPIIKKLKKKTDLFLVIGLHKLIKKFCYLKQHINRQMC